MNADDASSLIASIRNSLEKGKHVLVVARLVELRKGLDEAHLRKQIDSIIHDLAVLTQLPKSQQDCTLIEKKLDEIDVHVSQYRSL